MPETLPARSNKRLALFLDGTWNVVSDNTNVWRLRAMFTPIGADRREQRAYYSTGLGTKFGERIRGGMFGWGLADFFAKKTIDKIGDIQTLAWAGGVD